MRRIWLLAALLAGCGGDTKSDEERLQGTWVYEEDDGICSLALVFDGDKFTTYDSCVLEDDSIGMEVESGPFTVDGDEFTWTSESSSCEDADRNPETVRFELVSGDKLRLTTPDGIVVLERKKSRPTTGQAEFGCWDEDGYFTPGPLEPI